MQAKHKYTSHEYVKLHAAIEMKWRSIVSFHFTRTNVHEITQLESLIEPLWDLGDVYADSGYLSADNCSVIVMKGGTPYIHPKINTSGKFTRGRRLHDAHPFVKMFESYKQNPEKWMKKYHQRSVIEAVFSSMKRQLLSLIFDDTFSSKISDRSCLFIDEKKAWRFCNLHKAMCSMCRNRIENHRL